MEKRELVVDGRLRPEMASTVALEQVGDVHQDIHKWVPNERNQVPCPEEFPGKCHLIQRGPLTRETKFRRGKSMLNKLCHVKNGSFTENTPLS